MSFETIFSGIQTISIVLAIVVAMSTLRTKKDADVSQLVEMRVDLKYIKSTIDDIRDLPTRVSVIEADVQKIEQRLEEHIKDYKGE